MYAIYECVVTDNSHWNDGTMTQVHQEYHIKCDMDNDSHKKKTYLFWKVDTAPSCQKTHIAATLPSNVQLVSTIETGMNNTGKSINILLSSTCL